MLKLLALARSFNTIRPGDGDDRSSLPTRLWP
jgi:hypothetical protein